MSTQTNDAICKKCGRSFSPCYATEKYCYNCRREWMEEKERRYIVEILERDSSFKRVEGEK